MPHVDNDKKIANISSYNTFKVFEDIYSQEAKGPDAWKLTLPPQRKRASFLPSFLIFVFILSVLGLGLYPALSYLLKTPYPLLVVMEDSLQPVIERNDLILVKGVISEAEIQTNDLVVFKQAEQTERELAVQRVVDVDKDRGSLVVGNVMDDSTNTSIMIEQVVGKVVGEDNPFKVPLIGKVIGCLAKR